MNDKHNDQCPGAGPTVKIRHLPEAAFHKNVYSRFELNRTKRVCHYHYIFSNHYYINTQRDIPVLTLFHISHCDVIVDRLGAVVTSQLGLLHAVLV